MAYKRYLIPAALIVASAIAVTGFSCRPDRPGRLVLRFYPFVGDEPLVLERARYANPGGEGFFKVRDFQFFVSNIRLISDSAEFAEPESYHLARFDGDDGTHVIIIDDIPREDYDRIELGIGVDPDTNGTMASVGELDPNGRMAWSWETGYKFVLVEGALAVGDTQYPVVYHVGFDENYKKMSFELGEPLFDGAEVEVGFRVDLLQMFSGVETVDMVALSNVKFDHADAKLLADNYAHMVSLCTADCGF